MFADQSGFYLLAAAVATYAPRGQTPVLAVPLSWDHLSVMAAMTPAGKLYIAIQEQAFNGDGIVSFLKHLLRHIPGPLLLIWDGLPAHRGQTVKAFLRAGAAQRIHLERLPSYAPDLNPTEGIWHHLKHVQLRNLCCHSLPQLAVELRKAVARLRHKTDVIVSFLDRIHLGLSL